MNYLGFNVDVNSVHTKDTCSFERQAELCIIFQKQIMNSL